MELLPTLWAEKYKLKTEKGLPVDFYDHLFMYDIWNALAEEPKVCCMKAAQVSFSTTCIFVSFFVAHNKGMDAIYTLPTSSERSEFVSDKVNRIIAQNPILKQYTNDRDTIEQKQVGTNMIHYRSTWKEKNATTVSSDVNYYDEVDTSNMSVIEQYSTRQQHSKFKWERWFSHPSTEGTGVHKYWRMSDQRHWIIDCNHCGKAQYLSWDIDKPKKMSIDIDREIFICKHCGEELSYEARRNGHWQAKYKRSEQRPIVGFWIPLLICPWVSAKEIIGYWREKPPEYFDNKVLGLPHKASGNKLTMDRLRKNLTLEIITPDVRERVIMGIDTGLKLDYVMGSEKGLFFNGDAEDYDEFDRHMERWPRMIAIVDGGGDIIGSRKFKERWKGRVYLCFLGGDKHNTDEPKWNEDEHTVTVDRNRIIQFLVDEFTDTRIPLQGVEDDWHEYFLDWGNLSRKKIYDPVTGQFKGYKWIRNGRDHKALATVNFRVGMTRFSSTGKVIQSGNLNPKPNSYMTTIYDRTEINPLKPMIDAIYNPPPSDDWRDNG